MTESRGRQGRLRPGLGKLYPGIDSGVWLPVEQLLRHVAILMHRHLADPGAIAGDRFLRSDHFEFRGEAPRPADWPSDLSRMSDAAAPPREGPAS
ncbi:MAG TPA: hypothetical protein VIG08_10915 [Gemmatimonadales bacterium]